MNLTNLKKCLLCISVWSLAGLSHADRHALLIGVSDYDDPRIPDLEGPVNDVMALRDVLIRNWQFDDTNVHQLLDAQATEAGILNAIDALLDSTSPGDDIIIYYSGHGTSAGDPDLGSHLNLPDGSGAIVGSDFDPAKLNRRSLSQPANDGLLVGRYEIRPRLEELDKDRNILVIFDACFSGNAIREVSSSFRPAARKQLNLAEFGNFGDGGIDAQASTHTEDKLDTLLDKRPANRSFWKTDKSLFSYQNIVYFGAAAEDQFAVDLSLAEIEAGLVTTIDGKPHGGFTDSLLRALWTLPDSADTLSFVQLFNHTLNQFSIWCKVCGHTPVSLPSASSPGNALLGRVILSASATPVNLSEYKGTLEPQLQEALIVDDQLADAGSLALKGLLTSFSDTRNRQPGLAQPDVFLTDEGGSIKAYASDGHLITTHTIDTDEQTLSQWLQGRQWLKRRMARDLARQNGKLQASFRTPLASPEVKAGDFVYFSVLSETRSRLLVLLLDANSQLSLIYPVTDSERNRVLPAMTSQRIPGLDEPQLQVTPPWGTDTVLFYSLSDAHNLSSTLEALASITTIPFDHAALSALESLLDSSELSYGASYLRVIASE